MIMDGDDDQMIFGDLGALSFLTFVLQVRKNPEKTSPRKFVPTEDRTRARCVTGAHATACPTAVDSLHFGRAVLSTHIFIVFFSLFFD